MPAVVAGSSVLGFEFSCARAAKGANAARAPLMNVIRVIEKKDGERGLVECKGPIAPRFESPEIYNSYC
jgi:hypothetical protein